MGSLLNKLHEIKSDKLLHLICGIIINQGLFVLADKYIISWLSIVLAFIVSTVIMYLWEYIHDLKLKLGVYNIKDFYAGLIGIIIESVLLVLMII